MLSSSSSIILSVVALLALACGVSAHPRIDWVNGLDDCWEKCLQGTEAGCSSSKCICDASQDENYLPPAVSCMVRKCKADDWSIGFALLLPLIPYCSIAGNPVPENILSSASAAATATPTPTPSSKPPQKTNPPKQTSKHGEAELTKVYTTTLTQTTTDGEGNTLQVVVPIVIGPSGLSSGKPATSTLEGKATATDSSSSAPSSASASPSPTAGSSAPASTQGQKPASSTASSQPTQRVSNSNGSPFENMQAGASQWGISGVVVGLGVVVGIFMRL